MTIFWVCYVIVFLLHVLTTYDSGLNGFWDSIFNLGTTILLLIGFLGWRVTNIWYMF